MISGVWAVAIVIGGWCGCLAAQPGDRGLDALAILRRREGRKVDGMAAGATLQDDVGSSSFFVGEIVGRGHADLALAKR